MDKKKIIIIFLAIFLIGGGFIFYKKNHPTAVDNQKMTLKQASKIGEMTTHQLLVQIKKTGSSYERGDIILTKPADWEFSDTEKSIFLIVKMDLTPKQGELLALSLIREIGKKDETGQPVEESLKRRKFYVDLEKSGISQDDEKGGVVEDKIFQWDILKEKEL